MASRKSINSGKKSNIEGHKFESIVANYLTKELKESFIVKGQNNTKIDIISHDGRLRLSVKNAIGKNTQVSLLTQARFIKLMEIKDEDIILFINQFFGGNKLIDYPKHRLHRSQIEFKLNTKFVEYLNEKKSEIFDLIVTNCIVSNSQLNYMLWASEKNLLEKMFVIDLAALKVYYMLGNWYQNETTFEYRVNGIKLFHLQMKGSGKKYTSGYHALMFHIYGGNIDRKYVGNINLLKETNG